MVDILYIVVIAIVITIYGVSNGNKTVVLRSKEMFIEPCFLCGKRSRSEMRPKVISFGDYFVVKCPKCGLMVNYDEVTPTEEQAIELWNKRMSCYNWKLKVRMALLEEGRRW